jgi:peptidyl-prolyl cis-trans isomerase SurA
MRISALIICFFIFGSSIYAQNDFLIDKILAQVGGELILMSDIEEQYALLKESNPELKEDDKCIILQNILSQKLLVNQAKLDSLEVSDEEVETQLDARIDQILGYMGNDVGKFEDYYGESITSVKAKFRDDLRSQLFAQRMQASLMDQITVTPSEVKYFYSQIDKDSLPYFNSEVEIAEIFYEPKANENEKEIARSRLEDIRERIIGGEDFAELARIYSDDPGSARLGGDLGIQKRGTFVPEFEAAAFSLEQNEISDVVESEFGFHIIQLLEQRGNNIHPRHILITTEITWQDLEFAEVRLDSIRNLILWDSITFSQAVKKYSSEDAPSYNNDGMMVNPKTGNTFFETADLDPDIYFSIDTMQISDISAPIEVISQANETLFRLVKLISRTDPHKASLDQDYTKILGAAKEHKKTRFLEDWINSRINETFIQIDPIYSSCPNLSIWLDN